MSCAKMAEPTVMLFGIWTWVAQESTYKVGTGGAHWRHLANTTEMCGSNAACC